LGRHFACRSAKALCAAGTGFHDARENLERRGLAGAIGSNESKDLRFAHLHADAAYRLNGPITLPETLEADRCWHEIRTRLRYFFRLPSGHTSPRISISPSAGIPGLAKPMAPCNCSFTPTTCFTRSSRK